MPVNPITLNLIEPVLIKKIENNVVDRIVHEIDGIRIQKDKEDKSKKHFDQNLQKKASKKLIYFLKKNNIDAKCDILDDRVNIKLFDAEGNLIINADVKDLMELMNNISFEKGVLFDKKV